MESKYYESILYEPIKKIYGKTLLIKKHTIFVDDLYLQTIFGFVLLYSKNKEYLKLMHFIWYFVEQGVLYIFI